MSIVEPTIFREYLGAKLFPDFVDFPDIINPALKEFHFILAFATDHYDKTTKTATGNFTPRWDRKVFTPEKIKQLKHKYEGKPVDVKVVISIGGRGSQYPFNPSEKDYWLDNAKTSLTNIIKGFNDYCGCNLIDGIDINYETIESSPHDFAEYIGELLQSLKSDGLIKVASIAPSYAVHAQYKTLYHIHHHIIDWVDYQFYDQLVSDKDDFENLYRDLLVDYPDGNLLAGFSTDPDDTGKISREAFFKGCQELARNKLLPGIFVWDADDSAIESSGNPFQTEKLLQQILVDFFSIHPHPIDQN